MTLYSEVENAFQYARIFSTYLKLTGSWGFSVYAFADRCKAFSSFKASSERFFTTVSFDFCMIWNNLGPHTWSTWLDAMGRFSDVFWNCKDSFDLIEIQLLSTSGFFTNSLNSYGWNTCFVASLPLRNTPFCHMLTSFGLNQESFYYPSPSPLYRRQFTFHIFDF